MPCSEKGNTGIFRTLLICLVCFLGFLPWHPAALAQDSPAPVKEISVAVGQSSAPFYFRNGEGVADGWLSDLWRLWSKKTGIQVKFVMAPFGETLKLTKEGKVDVQGGCFYSEQRAAYLDYVAPLAKTDTHFFFHKNIYGIEALKDLAGFRIGVTKGDFCVGYLRKHLPGLALAEYTTSEALFKAIEKGKIRVFVMDTPIALYFLEKWKLLSSFNYYPDRPLYSNTFRAAVKKGDTVLPPVIRKGLSMITPEEKSRIERRWLGVSQTKTEGVLTIACDRYYPPFTMLTPSGRAAGILIDLWRLWGEKNIRKIEFIFDDWAKTIQLVKEGKADFHSGLFKTRAREKFLSFSVPVFAAQERLAFRKDQKPLRLDELKGERVGVIGGSAEETELRERHADIILSPFAGYRELLNALWQDEVLAVYDVGVTLQKAIEDLGLQGDILLSGKSGPVREIFAAVLKKNAFRLKSINQGISQITDQELKEIEARWISNPDMRMFSGKARPLVLTAGEKQWLKAHPQIKLGIDPDLMPFEGIGHGEVFEGIAASYADVLSRKLGVTMIPQKGRNFADTLDAARAGKVDVLPCVSMTPERRAFLEFTRPYMDFPILAVTRRDVPFFSDLNELKDQKVAVVEDYYAQDIMARHFPGIQLSLVKSTQQGLEAVEQGEAVAYVDCSANTIYAIRKLGLKDLKIAVTTPYRESVRFAVRKDWPQLATILEKALHSIPEKERERIANRWINVRFSERTDWALLLKVGVAAAVIIGLILAIILFWNRRLSREVGERKRAEERFQAIAATTPGAIIQTRFDAEGRPEVLYLSAKGEAFFGMPPNEVIQTKTLLPWHPEDQKRIDDEIRTDVSAGKDLNLVGRIEPSPGVIRWIRINASPSRSSEGEFIYNGFILDVTERKLAEQEYLNSERKIKAMSQAVDDALIMINGKGRVMFWNQAAEQLFDYTAAEAMDGDFHEIVVPETERPRAIAGLEQFSRTGEGRVLESNLEVTARNRAGDEFPVEVSIASFQVDDEWYAVGTVRDITDRKEAEEALRNSERRVKSILETANEGFFIVDNNQEVIEANPTMCGILDRELDEVIGMSLFDFVDEENKKIFQEQVELRNQGITNAYEIALSRPDGTHVFCIFNSTPLFDEKNRKIGAFAMVNDITERKQSEDRLRFTQTTVDKAALNIFWVDPETGMFTYANEAACSSMGYTREEFLGMHVLQIDTAFNEEKFAGLMEALEAHSYIETEGIHRTKGGRFLNISLSIVLTRMKDRRVIAIFAQDITDRLKAEKELKQNLEELEQFNQLVVGREEKMIGLKEEINNLLVQLGQAEKYEIVE